MIRVLCLIFLTAFAAHAQERTNEQLKQQARHFKNSKRFVISYDKFKDETFVKTGPFAVSGTARYMAGGGMIFLWASFRFSGQSIKQPIDTFALYFEHHGNDWQFLTTKEMYLLKSHEFRFGLRRYAAQAPSQGSLTGPTLQPLPSPRLVIERV